MKKYILLLIFSMSQVLANDNIRIKVLCNNEQKALHITIGSDKLNLTSDAVQDNLGGYVDIPEEKFYLKTETKVYHLQGIVENENRDATTEFSAIINNHPSNFITLKELTKLKSNKDLKFIQKIHLETTNEVVKNILDVYFDETVFDREVKRCK
ncbi:MAG: hypothetical protein U9O24_01530 [Campylobacterota bacterium]|nr:hypothetical protein [Campylobacterota bacterium]